jgi:hypothetical protein
MKPRHLSGKQWAAAIASLNEQWSEIVLALLARFDEYEGTTTLQDVADREDFVRACPEGLRYIMKALLEQYHD